MYSLDSTCCSTDLTLYLPLHEFCLIDVSVMEANNSIQSLVAYLKWNFSRRESVLSAFETNAVYLFLKLLLLTNVYWNIVLKLYIRETKY